MWQGLVGDRIVCGVRDVRVLPPGAHSFKLIIIHHSRSEIPKLNSTFLPLNNYSLFALLRNNVAWLELSLWLRLSPEDLFFWLVC